MILNITAYLGAALTVLIQGVLLFYRREETEHTGIRLINFLTLAEAALLSAVLINRSIEIRYAALSGTFESLIFYSFCLFLILGIYALQNRIQVFRAVVFFGSVMALGLLLIASSPLVSSDLRPPIPALRSWWLILHVALAFMGEAFFALSFGTAVLSLTSRDEKRAGHYDHLTYTAIVTGYPLFTLGALIFGAIWAESAWGSFWSWDPKETWALITWLVYTLYLHFRLSGRDHSRTFKSLLAIIGFLSTLFTFFGVNYLLGGLHSYG